MSKRHNWVRQLFVNRDVITNNSNPKSRFFGNHSLSNKTTCNNRFDAWRVSTAKMKKLTNHTTKVQTIQEQPQSSEVRPKSGALTFPPWTTGGWGVRVKGTPQKPLLELRDIRAPNCRLWKNRFPPPISLTGVAALSKRCFVVHVACWRLIWRVMCISENLRVRVRKKKKANLYYFSAPNNFWFINIVKIVRHQFLKSANEDRWKSISFAQKLQAFTKNPTKTLENFWSWFQLCVRARAW